MTTTEKLGDGFFLVIAASCLYGIGRFTLVILGA